MKNSELEQYMRLFTDAVLTGVDADGYPVSIRCQPRIDETASTLRIQLPAEIQIMPGPAGLLWHSHDKNLWKLKNFALQGKLEHQAEFSVFFVQRLLPGMNMAGAPGPISTIVCGKRTMKKILRKRGLAQPAIPWDRMKQLTNTVEDL